MPGITYEEFEQHYLRIIAQIALKAVQKGDIDIIEEFDPNGDLIEGVNLPNFLKRVDIEELGVEGFLPKQFKNIKGQQGLVSTKGFLTALGVDKNSVDDFRKQVKSEKDIFSRKIKDRNKSLRRNKLQSANAKEQLGIKILKISGVSEG